jgi:GT2 family glycosyltransferase
VNSVVVLAHNCLELSKRCIASIRNQDIPTSYVFIDNGSTDGTREWLRSGEAGRRSLIGNLDNAGVSIGWNQGIDLSFNKPECDSVLVVNNDTVLPPYFYRRLLEFNCPFVTGISVGSMEEIATEPPATTPTDGPDFSAFLIRRDAWKTIGRFDEDMVMYCSDLDYHLRAHFVGVKLLNGHIPFYHERSSTLNTAPAREKRLIQLRADADREVFKAKWGVEACSDGYAKLFSQRKFGVHRIENKNV